MSFSWELISFTFQPSVLIRLEACNCLAQVGGANQAPTTTKDVSPDAALHPKPGHRCRHDPHSGLAWSGQGGRASVARHLKTTGWVT